eukprot:3387025-Rhodomonas_salina.1
MVLPGSYESAGTRSTRGRYAPLSPYERPTQYPVLDWLCSPTACLREVRYRDIREIGYNDGEVSLTDTGCDQCDSMLPLGHPSGAIMNRGRELAHDCGLVWRLTERQSIKGIACDVSPSSTEINFA